MVVLDIVILLGVVLGCAYFRVSIIAWTIAIGVVLFFESIWGSVHFIFLVPFWLIYLAAACFANLKNLRQHNFTKPLVAVLQKKMPAISETEREAIKAGNVWWEKDLFCGQPDWKKLLAMPAPTLSNEEQEFIDNQVETLCNMTNDWEIVNESRDMPEVVWEYLKKERFFGMIIPKEYGGRGFSAYAHSTIVTKIASRSISVAVNTMVPNSLGPGELLLHYGTDANVRTHHMYGRLF